MSAELRVLIVEDKPDDAELMVLALQRGGFSPTWERVDTADGLRAALATGLWEAVLSDYTLPEFDAVRALKIVRAFDTNLPFIVVSGTVGEEVAVELMRFGANDYILKYNMVRLAPALERELLAAENLRERRAAERTAAHLAAIVESSVDAIVSETIDGWLTSWNHGAELLYGWTTAEAIGQHVSFLVPPDKTAERADIVKRVRAGEKVGCLETVRLHKDGRRIDISLTISPMRDANGRLIGLTKTGQDIRERKKAEAALRTSENRLRAIFQAEPECVKVIAREGHLLEMNPAGLAMLEVATLDEAKRHSLLEFVTPAFHDAFRELHRHVMSGQNGKLAYEIVGLNGTRRWLETHATPLRNDAGEIESLLGVTRDMTERHQAEVGLLESQERLTAALAASGTGTFRWDIVNDTLDWDEQLDHLFGLPPGKTARSLENFVAMVHPDDRAGVVDRCLQCKEQGADFSMEFRVVQPGGAVRWLDDRGQTSRGPDGRPSYMTGACVDITERKRAEEILRLSEQRYRSLVDATAAIVWDSPTSGEFDTYQPGWSAFTGQTIEQHKGWGWLNSIHPDDREKSGRGWAAALEQRTTYLIEHRVLRADGEYRDMTARAVPIFEADGAIREWVGVHTDVTDKKRSQEAALSSQQRLQRVLASSPAVLFTLSIADDKISGLTWISDNFQDMLGYPSEDGLVPDWWVRNLHPEEFESVLKTTHAELFAKGYLAIEYRIRHASGRYMWIRGEMRLIRDAEGRPLEAVGSWSDITERKRLEDQFHQSQKMEAFGQLAGGVAHDFNNLLTIINGYSELLLQKLPMRDPSRDMIAEILQAGERSAGLTRQLLAFSRQSMLAPRILDLNEVVTNTDKMLRRLIGEDIRLTTTLDSKLWAIRADPGQIEQVLMNLAVNARDAMPLGGRLTIETRNVELDEAYAQTHAEARAGRYVLLGVTDTGKGISPEILARVFEPFYTTKGPGKGTGLGLATVYGIVKQSGGHVTVYSEVGIGTSFKVYLPRIDKPSADSVVRPGIKASPRGTETILLAEDEAAVRTLTRLILIGLGYTVIEARDGVEAARLAAEYTGQIDLVITDVVMPGSGGRAVAEEVVLGHPETRVLFISGYTDDAVIRHGVLRDGVNFLQKPFTQVALAFKVRELLDAPVK
jgi:PAS domain S-box-containing protein